MNKSGQRMCACVRMKDGINKGTSSMYYDFCSFFHLFQLNKFPTFDQIMRFFIDLGTLHLRVVYYGLSTLKKKNRQI